MMSAFSQVDRGRSGCARALLLGETLEHVETAWTAFRESYRFWDYVTVACGMIGVFGFLSMFVWLLGLPGRIAVAREHPEAEAVYALGWSGFLAVVPWINAFIWAFKPTDVIDIRRFPKEEREAIKRDLERLNAYAYGKTADPGEKDTGTPALPDPKPGKDV